MPFPANYDLPVVEQYKFAAQAFGNATKTFNIIGPKGKKGLVRDILVDITADMVGTTAVPEVDVGTGSGDTAYAQYRLGSAAGSGYTAASTPRRASQEAITGNAPRTLSDFSGHVALEKAAIPKDTAAVITLKAGTGGAPAGTADVTVTVHWF